MSLLALLPEERPRERLMNQGVEALSLTELIAILLTTGTKGKTVLELAQEITTHFGSLEELISATLEELSSIKGLGPAKAIQLQAAFGIAKRVRGVARPKGRIHASEAYELIKDELSIQKEERLVVVLKDVREQLIAVKTVSIGTVSEVLMHPREVLYPAIRHKAVSFILAHNHPSGDPTPSKSDFEVTRRLITSSQLLGIGFDDHIIVGRSSFVSLRAGGFLASVVG